MSHRPTRRLLASALTLAIATTLAACATTPAPAAEGAAAPSEAAPMPAANPFFAPRIKDWLQTIRKRNGFVIFLTPNIESAVHSAIGDILVQQSATSIFLPNHKATHEGYCGAFKLSEKEYELVRTLDPQDRCFLVKHGKDSVLARLDLTGMEDFIPILSGTTKNVALLDQLVQEQGEDPEAWLPIFQERTRK